MPRSLPHEDGNERQQAFEKSQAENAVYINMALNVSYSFAGRTATQNRSLLYTFRTNILEAHISSRHQRWDSQSHSTSGTRRRFTSPKSS